MHVGLHLLENSVQEYAWGSHTAIAELRGLPSPTPEPQAELWMGAHPQAPSRVRVGGEAIGLDELIRRHPEAVLGRRVADRFGPALPFLLKVLAAEEPLSIQAHPSLEQARAGFARENAAGIPLGAPERNYRDANHKPEVLAPLSRMWALQGFRHPAETQELLGRLGEPSLDPMLLALAAGGYRELLASLFGLPADERSRLVGRVLASLPGRVGGEEARWVARLAARRGRDPGVLAPLFLNLLCLSPGQAVFLAAGELHAYLEGTGVELMANSDNVLRGGLTSKHVDVPELLATLSFEGGRRSSLAPRILPSGEELFETPAEEFRLSRVTVSPARPFRPAAKGEERAVEILLVTEGQVEVAAGGAQSLRLARGQSCLVASAAGPYAVSGSGAVHRATVP